MDNLSNFYIDDYITIQDKVKTNNLNISELTENKLQRFNNLCSNIRTFFNEEWDRERGDRKSGYDILLQRQKNAIIGYKKEVGFFKDKINEYLKNTRTESEWFPHWYSTLCDAIFHEVWGLAGISMWVNAESLELRNSSSAKIIGDRIYYLIDGKQVLQKQTISRDRRKQLRKALLLKTPKKRLVNDYAEVYLIDGTRITIYGDDKTKPDQDSIVFRKFLVRDYTFERQAEMGTIPKESISLFKHMIAVGFNIAFIGAVRTAKTTFLTTWQSYENPELEGVMIETDPEIPLHKIMPKAPIMQLLADGEELEKVVKSVLRSDLDYGILAEARDGRALNIAIKLANKGTRRVKMTFHTTDAIDFCYDVADEIMKVYGGSLYSTIVKVAKSVQYLFEFVQLKDKSKKRLKAIYEIRYNNINHVITIHQICRYRYNLDCWQWRYDIGEDKEKIGEEEDYESFTAFGDELKKLAEQFPMDESYTSVFTPEYQHLREGVML